ncbi:MAG TPA: cytidylate kinase-like family protein [Anaerolineales bacterium]|nr:cytidylate kinase-like family protein [Anaerolineales bacterium]
MPESDPIQRWSITLSRLMGSLGEEVALLAGEELGFRIVRKELINLAARQSGHPEIGLAAIDDLHLFNINPTPQATRTYQEALARLVHEEADRGACIIIGRAGQAILKSAPRSLHVRITAPLELRVARVAARLGIPAEAAHEQIKATDRSRSYYVRRYYHIRWDDPNEYDLVLNTGRLSASQAASMLCAALRARLQSI